MGVNMAGFAVCDDEVTRRAARQEIIRRYYKAACDYKSGNSDEAALQRIQLLMNENKISVDERTIVRAALEKAEKCNSHAVAIQLEDGRIVTGKSSKLMSACFGRGFKRGQTFIRFERRYPSSFAHRARAHHHPQKRSFARG